MNESNCYLGLGKERSLSSFSDLLGNTIIQDAGAEDPTLSVVAGVIPPLRFDGSTDKNAMAISTAVHTFVGSRGSSVDAAFDVLAR